MCSIEKPEFWIMKYYLALNSPYFPKLNNNEYIKIKDIS